MTIIHLKRYYKHLTEDITLEVPDEIATTLSLGGRTCESYLRKKWYHHEYSLDCDDGIENDVTRRPDTPEEIFVREETEAELYAALAKLPTVQARRIFAHYILGMKKVDIARAEGVCDSCVCGSIKTGLANLKKILKETM